MLHWRPFGVTRRTVHKHRNLIAHAPKRLHDKITADDTDVIYAGAPEKVEKRRKAFLREWRLQRICRRPLEGSPVRCRRD